MTNDSALALAAAVAATPLVVWAARLAPRRRRARLDGARAELARAARARDDRALWQLIRTRCTNPTQCPICTAHAHRAEGTDQ
ncbi:hypothetical protein [Streptomyces antarcticus]|uniref:hypothetical protein n=1 Tax=Streptomyces antarcticus TaxID=2996458 RepID=UPI00226EDD89|nr:MULTISPECIES: hypothetical protein [unclassified Streptomyces]MCY0944647.1 hypothetical protein [Streptomyces sp. H34-AA3]MCZ4087804.1 hypothetical protein [Streptomyces sp. H34-S5]